MAGTIEPRNGNQQCFSSVAGAIAKPFTMLLKELKEFCGETSIHGLGQIANDNLSILKRLLWFGIFAGCIVYAGTQLFSSIKGTFESPIHIAYVSDCDKDDWQKLFS